MRRIARYSLLSGGLSIILLLVPIFGVHISAGSPPFVRQFISNHQPLPDDDFVFRVNNKEASLGSSRTADFVNTTDIKQVRVSSNGETLDAVMQMQSDIPDMPPVLEWRYDMLIDVFSNIDTDTFPRHDYIVGIKWHNNTWTEQIEEAVRL